MKKLISIGLLCLTAVFLSACGGGASNTSAITDMAMPQAAYEEQAAGAAINSYTGNGAEGTVLPEVSDTARKLIRTVDLSVETEHYDQLMEELETRIAQLGGYIEFKEAYHSSPYGNSTRSASLQVRIPANRMNELTDKVKEAANVTRESEAVEDVTLTYVDLESHKKMLLTQQERLITLLEQAQTIEDIIALENRLSEVRYQIESMEAQLRTYDNLVDYGTINLYIEEVERYTPQQEKGTWERIRIGFSENLYLVGNGVKNFAIEFVIALPILAVWAVVILILLIILRFILKWEKKKNLERAALRQEKKQQLSAANTKQGELSKAGEKVEEKGNVRN